MYRRTYKDGVHFPLMHCLRKSFMTANGCLFSDRRKTGGRLFRLDVSKAF